jgi:acyl-CoA hydrolase
MDNRLAFGPARKAPADSATTLVHIMSKDDTNPHGTVPSGAVMRLIDDAASAAAGRHADGPAVTVRVDRMAFHTPVRAGDLLTVSAVVEQAGRTSMVIAVEVTAERWNAPGAAAQVATGCLTFVAVDADGLPRHVPKLVA